MLVKTMRLSPLMLMIIMLYAKTSLLDTHLCVRVCLRVCLTDPGHVVSETGDDALSTTQEDTMLTRALYEMHLKILNGEKV